MTAFLDHFRHALRRLAAQPVFFATAVLTLMLGIGAVTSIFTVYDAVFLKPLPFRDADRIVRVLRDQPPVSSSPVSPPVLREWQAGHGGVFDAFGAWVPQTVSLTGEGEAVRLNAYLVTPGFWQVFSQPVALGRAFGDEEENAGERVVVIGEALWRDRFDRSPDVIGREIRLNGEAWRVIGVTEAGFRYPEDAQLWMPSFLPANTAGRGSNSFAPVARLRQGVSATQAQAAMRAVTQAQAAEFPDNHAGLTARVMPLRALVGRTLQSPMSTLLAAAVVVLLIACANLANLMLTRGQSRAQELALRRALGAGTGRLLGDVMAEAALIALAGAVLALAVAPFAVHALLAMAPDLLPSYNAPGVDLRAIAITAGLALATLMLFAWWPARRAASADPVQAMQGASRSQTGSRAQVRLRSWLVRIEMALAMMLLVGAGLLIDSLRRLSQVDAGLAEPQSVLAAGISMPAPVMQPGEDFGDWYARSRVVIAPRIDAIVQRLGSLPGVSSVAVSERLPASGQGGWNGDFGIAGRELPDERLVEYRFVSPDYFRTFGIALKSGRAFNANEGDEALFPTTALVNESFVRTYLGGDDAVGAQVSTFDGGEKTIVGVVADVRQQGLDRPAVPEIYFPARTVPVGDLVVAVKTQGDALALSDSLRRAMKEVAADTPVLAVRTMDAVVGDTLALRRFNMSLSTAFAAVAVLLAVIGLYGVIAWSVEQRRREIGVRQSLGATRGAIHRMVLGDGLRIVLPGLLAGAIGAVLLGRLVAAQLYGVDAGSPVVMLLAALLLAAVAMLACLVPTRRAARVSPMTALRDD